MPALRGPDAILGRHLGGDVDLLRGFAHDLPDQLLAVAVAIGERGIDQVDAQFDGAAQRGQRFVVRAAEPLLAADAPGAVADVADFEAGPAEFAILHDYQLNLDTAMVTPGWELEVPTCTTTGTAARR